MIERFLGWLEEGSDRRYAKRYEEHQERERQRKRELEKEAQEKRRQYDLQSKALAMLREGKVPNLNGSISAPFRMQKNERLILSMEGVAYSEVRTKREIQGRSAGASIRVAKGVSLRAGGSRGAPVETDVLTPRGTGIFAISTKHIFFHGERAFRIPLSKIVSAQRLEGGVYRGGARQSERPTRILWCFRHSDSRIYRSIGPLDPNNGFWTGRAECSARRFLRVVGRRLECGRYA